MLGNTATSSTTDDLFTLQVGEREFITSRNTLASQSGYFASLFSGRWSDERNRGPFFVDADGDLFEHILRYLRCKVFPVFFDQSRGHDHALYLALLGEARYFQINRLMNWLEKKEYVRAVKVERTAKLVDGTNAVNEPRDSDVSVEVFPILNWKRVFLCPKKEELHRGNPKECKSLCGNYKDNHYGEDYVLQTVIVEKRVVLDKEVCLNNCW